MGLKACLSRLCLIFRKVWSVEVIRARAKTSVVYSTLTVLAMPGNIQSYYTTTCSTIYINASHHFL